MGEAKHNVYLVRSQGDMNEGRGGMVVDFSAAFTNEQAAWDSINDAPGVMGRHPRKMSGGKIKTWQQAKRENATFGCDHDVVTVPMVDRVPSRRQKEMRRIESEIDTLQSRLNHLRETEAEDG